jgi:hypothetical protein
MSFNEFQSGINSIVVVHVHSMGYMDTVWDTWTQYGIHGHSMGYMAEFFWLLELKFFNFLNFLNFLTRITFCGKISQSPRGTLRLKILYQYLNLAHTWCKVA